MAKNKQEEFLKKTKEAADKRLEPVALKGLAKMLSDDLRVYDINYIDARTRQIIEEKLQAFEFANEEIKKLRQELLKKATMKAAQKKIVLPKAQIENESTDREKRCEPLCQLLAYELLEDVLFDDYYLEEAVKQDDFLLAFNRLRSMMDILFDMMSHSLEINYKKASEKLWGKDKFHISVKEIDEMVR